jgi:hypothetical protein
MIVSCNLLQNVTGLIPRYQILDSKREIAMAVLGRGGDTHPHASVATHADADADADFDAVESESEYDPVRAALEFPGIASFTEVSLYKPPLGSSAHPSARPSARRT